MKYKIFLFIFLICRTVTAQVSYKGIVIDAVTDLPIKDVNITILNKNVVIQTDNKGYFEILCSPDDSIRFTHLVYNTVKLKGKELTSAILMLEKTFELTGVIISAETTRNLLKKAINNLYSNLITKANIPYMLFHENKADSNIIRTCNAEMLLIINGQKRDKNLKSKWYLSTMISKQIDSLFCASYPWTKDNLNVTTDPEINLFLETYNKIDKTLLYEKEIDNDSLIVIRTFPKIRNENGFITNRFYIDKKDTVWFKRTSENNVPLKYDKIHYKNKIFKCRIITYSAYSEYKKGKSGYYNDTISFRVEREFQDFSISHYSQFLTLKSSEPEPYNEKKIPETKRHKVHYSSYLYDHE
jgi:hypothetical protein